MPENSVRNVSNPGLLRLGLVGSLGMTIAAMLLMTPLFAQAPASSTQAMYQTAAKNLERKFDYIEQNSQRPKPNQTPTIITERELNSCLMLQCFYLPNGVKSLQVSFQPGVMNATAQVDFDQVTNGHYAANPMMLLFRGVHEVKSTAHVIAEGGIAKIHVDTVSLDGVNVPRSALEFFAEKFITPKHPELGLDSTVKLPYRIDQGRVQQKEVVVTQK